MKWLLNFVFGKSPLDTLMGVYTKYKDSAIESERIQADLAKKQIDVILQSQQAAKDIRIATAGQWEMRLLAFLVALPFVIHVNLVGLDTNFGAFVGTIPKFPSPMDEWEGAILLSFFGVWGLTSSAKSIAAGLALRKR